MLIKSKRLSKLNPNIQSKINLTWKTKKSKVNPKPKRTNKKLV